MTKKICSVVFHTHWDREWYFPFETFRARLIRVMERVASALENNELDSFLFDGQVVAAEDLLATCEPELAERLHTLMQQGRLVLGPWYVMADEFLCSGESLIRNLEVGRKLALSLGNYQKVGYLPDTFGHIGQMPQLLQGFDIDNAVMWRGIDQQSSELRWQAEDGSEVFMLFLTEGYYQHPLNIDNFVEGINLYLDKISERANSEQLLLTQGGDHLRPSEGNMAERIALFNAQSEQYQLKQNNLTDYINDLQQGVALSQLPSMQGELRGNEKAFVLPDVLSTRRYLKQQNQQGEDRLTAQVEPLLAMAPIEHYPNRYLEESWKMLLVQHAHDSICGCSVDEVHREMESRTEKLAQRCDAMEAMALLSLGCISDEKNAQGSVDPFADDVRFTLFNPSPKRYKGWITEKVFLQGDLRKHLVLSQFEGDEFEPVVIKAEPGFRFTSPIDDFPDRIEGHWYELGFISEVEGLSHCEFTVSERPTGQVAEQVCRRSIENDIYRIELQDDATLTITDKRNGKVLSGVGRIESSMDAGDSYNFAPPMQDNFSQAKLNGNLQTRLHPSFCELSFDIELAQPKALAEHRRHAVEAEVLSHGQMQVRLFKGSEHIECHLVWHNNAQDHRLSLHIPTGEKLAVTHADSAFEVVSREAVYQDNNPVQANKEAKVSVNPSQSFVHAGGVQYIHQGTPEYRVVADDGDELAITLLRSVGWLSRRDFSTRGNGAGPDLPTPEAQCLGKHEYHFSLVMSDFEPAAACNRAAWFRHKPMLLQGHSQQWLDNVVLSNEALQVSAVRRLGDELELRVWNPTEAIQPLTLNKVYRVVALDGRYQATVTEIKPKQILTVRIAHSQ